MHFPTRMPTWSRSCGGLAAQLAMTFFLIARTVAGEDANRFTYLDEPLDPYYVGRHFPKLTTPQWVGEEGVDAVVVLAIDDMRDPAKYEAYLRPILDRLKQIDGRAAASIMTCQVDPNHPQLQTWIREGVSLEVHTVDHPCPLLGGGDFAKAKSTYDRCVDLLYRIPGSPPVAFRMPCCDSKNTPSPRFWTEIFNRTTPTGHFLAIDTSVFQLFTPHDRDLPAELTRDANGGERFRRYIPFPSFVNTIEDYPYPYVIGQRCWEFPCMVPSDWSAQYVQKPNNPETVLDLQRALDATVIKQGVLDLVFHPHGWIRNDQVVQLIDHAVGTHGKRVKFLSFREALQRLDRHLLDGRSLRDQSGNDRGVRLLDLNGDGAIDCFFSDGSQVETRIWQPEKQAWATSRQALAVTRPRFGVVEGRTGFVGIGAAGDNAKSRLVLATLDAGVWTARPLEIDEPSLGESWNVALANPATLADYRLRDLDGDTTTELFLTRGEETRILRLQSGAWRALPFSLPEGTRLVATDGLDAGLRWRDVNNDQRADLLFSDADRYAVHLFRSGTEGWTGGSLVGQRGEGVGIPMFVRPDGTNNGVWFHSDQIWFQNEDTDRLADNVDRVSFAQLAERIHEQRDRAGKLPTPTSPDEALASFRLPEGATIELVAAEPLVVDPVAFDWGPDGRLWVVEMRDYPNGLTWQGPGDPVGEPGGRVKVLEDTNGDGRFDHASIFLDKLPFPNGIKVWRKGAIVTAAPDVFYAEDTDGDGVADKQETLYKGFVEGNQQHRVNGLRWGIDGWLYLANGDSGGHVSSVRTGASVAIGGRDLRIRPDDGSLEAQSGQTQFGRATDAHGNWFGGHNSEPLWHFVLDDHYLRRNPLFASPPVRKIVPEQPGAAAVFPTSRTLARFNDFDRANRFTSACSPMIFADDSQRPGDNADGEALVYICEPVHNLIHRERLTAAGVTFTSRRLPDEQRSEFLASSDNGFRPVMIRTGPDGALWIADMYRLVIEHPEWIPVDWQRRLELRSGSEQGRIYRVFLSPAAAEAAHREGPFRPGAYSTRELVLALDDGNGARRDLVQQLLTWRHDKQAIEPLKRVVRHSHWPNARIPALYLLDHLHGADASLLTELIRSSPPALQRHAIRLAESRLAKNAGADDQIGAALLALVDARWQADPATRSKFSSESPGKTQPGASLEPPSKSSREASSASPDELHVDMQLAYSLGEWRDARAAAGLARLLVLHHDDPHITAAALSSIHAGNLAPVVREVLVESARHEALEPVVAQLLGFAAGLDDRQVLGESVAALLTRSGGPDDQPPRLNQVILRKRVAMRGLIESLDRRQKSLADLLDAEPLSTLRSFLDEARQAASTEADSTERVAAVALLGRFAPDREADRKVLTELIAPRNPPDVQEAAVRSLAAINDEGVPAPLLAGWPTHSPAVRAHVLDVLLTRVDWTRELLTAIQRGDVRPGEIDARRRQQLGRHRESSVRELAASLFVDTQSSRQSVLATYQSDSARSLSADIPRGKALFVKRCATCHRLEDVGQPLGPDLSALSDKSRNALLVAILDPNRAVEDKFLDYLVVTATGQQFTGMLVGETAAVVTLANTEGKQQSILRADIDEFRSTGRSLMPEGLEKDLTPQDVADLVAYIRATSAPPKQFPGNEHRPPEIREDGSIRLLAMHGRIYGPTLVFETQYRNVGFWGSLEDRVEWSFNVPTAGEYRVSLDYACHEETAGDRFVIRAGDQTLGGRVKSTGTWDDYRSLDAGTVRLPAGPVDLLIQSDGPPRKFLMDLRGIRLQPVRGG